MEQNAPRQPAPTSQPVALTVAGSDSGGGAGIQADLKTMEAAGVFGTSVVTSVTAQHTQGVESTHILPAEEVDAQLSAVFSDFDIRALKTGMLATAELVELVTEWVQSQEIPAVVDPVMVAATGDRLLEPDAEQAYKRLIEAATLVTPNADEAAVLTDIEPETSSDLQSAGKQLCEMGADAALVKGGHLSGEQVTDVFVSATTADQSAANAGEGDYTSRQFTHPRIEGAATHGSGCTLASAITAQLAQGTTLEKAVKRGIEQLSRAIRYHHAVGSGGAVHHSATQQERAGRTETIAAVERCLRQLHQFQWQTEGLLDAIVPEVGMQIAGATPYAERVEEIAAIDGRITRTSMRIRETRGVRFGASSHIARLLLTAREFDPSLRFAANCRYDNRIDAVLAEQDWAIASFDRTAEPTAEEENSTMSWGTKRAFESVAETPVAIVDDGAHGKEPMTRLLATDAETLADRLCTIASRVAAEQ